MILVIPCYDEEKRLDPEGFCRIVDTSPLSLLFVDDGSTDRTGEILARVVARLDGRGELLTLPRDGGKGEAVRQGMLHAFRSSPAFVGFADRPFDPPRRDRPSCPEGTRPPLHQPLGVRLAPLPGEPVGERV